ncbi:MAG TPA: enolase C-terminal domain-like protein [Nitrospira sp.]|jgi:L-alanine-DL-glutamate epimerase-like enolase superfamily enzyme|nr:enolase C-terminal domain-like protein [Nitrospira sp.]
MGTIRVPIKQHHYSPYERPRSIQVPIEHLDVSAYVIPTDGPESDGTLEWHHTLLLLVEARAAGQSGLGYSYAGYGSAAVIKELLVDVVVGHDALSVEDCWSAMLHAVRNIGRPGAVAMGISAVDAALWDLKARLLNLPLVALLGSVRDGVPIYGSGGFISYDLERLTGQLAGWVEQGIPRVKMKVGQDAVQDVKRIDAVRQAIGEGPEIFIDANGGYAAKEALRVAEASAERGVTWFEEPVSSDDLEGLHLLRERVPAPVEIAAGEYGSDPWYFRRMLQAKAVDVLQADATRCCGITGFLKAAALCEAEPLPLSAHCAPALHMHACCAARPVRHIEYFYDHVRIERMLFDGVIEPLDGMLYPDRSRPGLGLEFKRQDAQRYEV